MPGARKYQVMFAISGALMVPTGAALLMAEDDKLLLALALALGCEAITALLSYTKVQDRRKE